MVGNRKALVQRHCLLTFFNLGIVELLDLAAVQAHQVIVVLTFIDFVHRLARLKVTSIEQAGLLELGQYAVNRGQADVGAFFKQHAKHVFGRHVALPPELKNLQDFQARQRGLEAGAFNFFDVGHEGVCSAGPRCRGGCRAGWRRHGAVSRGTLPVQ